MKKSFMTRILATGLSFAMAFSMAAATNVTTASAAVKKASVTSFMKASSKTVVEGKTVTTYMKSNVAKKYRIKKHTESTVAKKYISVENISSRKGLKITAKEGALAAANLEKKGVNVKIYFAPGKSAAAAKKATATKYVNLKVVVMAKEEKPVEKLEAVQTGIRAITVTNSVDFSDKTITVKKGSSTVNCTTEFSADGKTAVVSFPGDLVDATYTVLVGEESLSVVCKPSEVKEIVIVGDKVAMNGDVGNAATKEGYAGYVVKNQFGDDITSKTTLTANSSATNVSAADGKLTFTWSTAPRLNDIVSIVLMTQDGRVTVNQTLTVSNQAVPYEVEVFGVYNEDGKTLTATNIATNDFYFLFNAKDQYGNIMAAKDVKAAIAGTAPYASKYMYVNSAMGLTNLEALSNITPQVMKVNGKEYVAYQLQLETGKVGNPGTATIMLIPGGSGKTVTETVEVQPGATVKKLTVTVPSAAPSGGSCNLDFTALDADGNEVTDFNALKKITSSSNKFYFVKENGTTKLKFDDSKGIATGAGSVASTVFTLQDYTTTVTTINVLEASVNAAVTGIDSTVALAAISGNAVSIPVKKISIDDQYGNGIGNTKLATSAAQNGKVYLMLVKESESLANLFTVSGDVSGTYQANVNASTKSAVILTQGAILGLTGNNIGSADYTLKLVTYDSAHGVYTDYETNINLVKKNITASSGYTFTVKSTNASKYRSYEVDAKDTINASATSGSACVTTTGYESEVKVYAVISGGQKVKLTSDGITNDFTIKPISNVTVTSGCMISANVSNTVMTDNNPNVTGKYTVIINATGEEITKEVTLCKWGAGVASLKFNTPTDTDIKITTTAAVTGSTILKKLKGTDSYGFDIDNEATGALVLKDGTTTVASKVTMVVTDIYKTEGSGLTVVKNGSTMDTIQITGGQTGDSYTIKIMSGATEIFTTTVNYNI